MGHEEKSSVRRWRRYEDVAFRNIDGECVIVPMRGSPVDLTKVFLLNRVGSHLWLELEKERTILNLCESLVKRFEIDLNTAATDVADFLGRLERLRLVEMVA